MFERQSKIQHLKLTLVINRMASFSASLCAEFSDSRLVTRPDELDMETSSFASLSKVLISTITSFLN